MDIKFMTSALRLEEIYGENKENSRKKIPMLKGAQIQNMLQTYQGNKIFMKNIDIHF